MVKTIAFVAILATLELASAFFVMSYIILGNFSIITLASAFRLGNAVSHVGLVDHEEDDRDGLLPAEVRVNVPADEEDDELVVECGLVD